MITEVSVAVSFVTSFLYGKLPRRRVHMLGEELDKAIQAKFQGHWYPDQPLKGTAYRCLKLSGDHPDLLLFEAARDIGLEVAEILQHLPDSLTMWIDPGEVSYRIGEKGAVSVLYTDKCHDESPSEFNPEAQDFVPASEQLLMAQNFAQLGLGQLPSPQQDLISNYSHYMHLQKSNSAPNFFTAAAFAQTKFGSTKLRQQTRRNPASGRMNQNGHGNSRGAPGRAGGGGGGGPFSFGSQQPPQSNFGRQSSIVTASTTAAAAFNRSFSMSPGVGYSAVDWSTGLGGPSGDGGSGDAARMLSVHIPVSGASHLSSNGSSRQGSPGAMAAAAAAAAAAASGRHNEQLLLAK